MRDFTLRKWLLAVLLLTPWIASAAGLGRLTVLSTLGQPFNAEIDLVSVQKEDLSSLSVRLASFDAYRQANLQYSAVVAGLRLRVERRPNGQSYVKVTSERAVNDPFVDLLIELNWAAGRLMREYTALIDPPGVAPVQATAPAQVAVPEPRPAPAPRPAAARPMDGSEVAAGGYGPIQRGETLSKIARSLKPEDVTLEQMLVGLYRSNPDAFIKKNMNLVRSGKILRVPDKTELAAIPHQEAVKEYRAQVADWNAYRGKLADAAGMAPEGRAAASGRITTRIEDKATAGTKDVVRLSKGDAPSDASGAAKGGKLRNAADRLRSLEEEVIAREKALTEANERIALLEKTIKDMQRLAEIKSPGMAAAQQQAAAKTAPKPEADKPAPKPEAAKPEPKPEAAKPEAKPEAAKPEAKPAEKPAVEAKADQPKPKPKPAAPPPPPPEPELIDIVMDNLPLIGGGAIVLGGLGLWFMRRRRAQPAKGDEPVKLAPTLGAATGAPAGSAVSDMTAAASAAPAMVAAAEAGELDPLEEARVYLSHGRDAQAEAILKEAVAKSPRRHDTQVALLEIYAARKDKAAFAHQAAEFHEVSGDHAETWLKVAAMGYAIDPGNPLYAAGKDASSVAPPAAEALAVDLDFDLDAPAPSDTVKSAPDASAGFKIEVPPVEPETKPDIAHGAQEPMPAALDFNLELPKVDALEAGAPAQPKQEQGADVDFKLDFGNINLNLDDKQPAGAASGADKDAHWYDVQQKFDLAKVYQEMGEKNNAMEILEEVMREGDAEQRAQAKALLDTLG